MEKAIVTKLRDMYVKFGGYTVELDNARFYDTTMEYVDAFWNDNDETVTFVAPYPGYNEEKKGAPLEVKTFPYEMIQSLYGRCNVEQADEFLTALGGSVHMSESNPFYSRKKDQTTIIDKFRAMFNELIVGRSYRVRRSPDITKNIKKWDEEIAALVAEKRAAKVENDSEENTNNNQGA